MYKQINARAGNNISDSQPIKTYSKMFQSLKPRWEYDNSALMSNFLIGVGVLIVLAGFPVDIVRNRQVWSCLKMSDLWCLCFHWKIFFWSLLKCPMFFDNFLILMQIRKYLNVNVFNPSWQLGEKTWKVFQKCTRPIFWNVIIAYLEQVFVLAAGNRKWIKIQQIQSQSIKLKLLDEIFGGMAKKSMALTLNIYLVIL